MPFCPECRYEYKAERQICPDCNVALVDQLSGAKAATTPNNDWVPVGRVQTEMKLELARGALESNDIPVVMVSGSAGQVGSGNSGVSQITGDGSGGYTLLVHHEQLRESEIILEAVLGNDFVRESV